MTRIPIQTKMDALSLGDIEAICQHLGNPQDVARLCMSSKGFYGPTKHLRYNARAAYVAKNLGLDWLPEESRESISWQNASDLYMNLGGPGNRNELSHVTWEPNPIVKIDFIYDDIEGPRMWVMVNGSFAVRVYRRDEIEADHDLPTDRLRFVYRLKDLFERLEYSTGLFYRWRDVDNMFSFRYDPEITEITKVGDEWSFAHS